MSSLSEKLKSVHKFSKPVHIIEIWCICTVSEEQSYYRCLLRARKISSYTIIAGKVNYDRWKPVLLKETSMFNRNLELSVKTSTYNRNQYIL